MPKFKFEELVYNITQKAKPIPGDEILYIGLEHLDSGSLKVNRWGSKVQLKGDKLKMEKGDILFGRRNTYLKRVAIAPHNGLFSAHGMIFRPKTQNIDKDYLPFFIASDYFMDEAIKISVGSLSPTVNWKELKELEFEIPSMEEQRKLVEVLIAANSLKEKYEHLLSITDELVKSQFIEMFGSPVSLDKGWQIMTVGDVATSQLGKMLNAKNQTGNHQRYYLANRNVQWFSLDFEDFRMMDFDEADRKKYALQAGDLLVCEGGEIGRCAVWHNEIEDCYIQNAVHRVRCNPDLITPLFLGHILYYHAQENGFSDIIGSKATIAHLPADKLKAMKIFVPPMDMQLHFERLVEQSDKSKLIIEYTENLVRRILNVYRSRF